MSLQVDIADAVKKRKMKRKRITIHSDNSEGNEHETDIFSMKRFIKPEKFLMEMRKMVTTSTQSLLSIHFFPSNQRTSGNSCSHQQASYGFLLVADGSRHERLIHPL